jgi:hypothetical protein
VPARSTTRAVTDSRTRRALLGAFAVLLVVALGWLLTARPPAGAPPNAPPAPAADEPLVVGDGRTVTLISLGGPATYPVLERVAAGIGTAVDQVEAFWGTDWTHDIVVVATATEAQFSAQAAGASTDIAAVSLADGVDPARRLATGQRIVLAPGASGVSADALRIVLGHELFHYAARADTAQDAPRWLTEAVADFVARPATPIPDRLRTPTALPSDAEFTATGSQLSDAYDRAWLFARFVADRFGAPTLKALYQRAAGAHHADIPAALREVLRMDPDDVLTGWRAWLKKSPPG